MQCQSKIKKIKCKKFEIVFERIECRQAHEFLMELFSRQQKRDRIYYFKTKYHMLSSLLPSLIIYAALKCFFKGDFL